MTVHDAAALLGVSRATFHRLMKAHNLTPLEPNNPALQRVRRYHFHRADVLALAQELGVVLPPAEPPPVVTDFLVTTHTPPVVARVERLLRDPAPRPD